MADPGSKQKNVSTLDRIYCKGLNFEAQIGFHDYELKTTQKIVVDLLAYVEPPLNSDAPLSVRMDYYKANQLIKELVQKSSFQLIETLAEKIAKQLLKAFDIRALEVTLTKFPLDMPNAVSVSYILKREKE